MLMILQYYNWRLDSAIRLIRDNMRNIKSSVDDETHTHVREAAQEPDISGSEHPATYETENELLKR